MSLLISSAAIRAYDALKQRPGARPRYSDARDAAVLAAIRLRMNELISSYRLIANEERGHTYVFWSELTQRIDEGLFDDLLDRL